MRYDAPVRVDVVLDLLARADTLAVAASEAIVAGDDTRLAALLDDREVVIGAVVSALRETATQPVSADQLDRVSQAARSTLAVGLQTRATAQIARDEVVLALSVLDARQQASQEYRPSAPERAVDVRL